jgi:spore coat polysaccharide biosynthesis protein SpsF
MVRLESFQKSDVTGTRSRRGKNGVQRDILVVIQVRYNSKRLPGKAILPFGGVPMIVYLLRRLACLSESYNMVVATTVSKEDDIIEKLSAAEEVNVFRGQEDDVLSRYIQCLAKFSSKIVVRVTADNPFTDPHIITKAVLAMKKGGYDYVRAIEGFALGIGVDVFTRDLLEYINQRAHSAYEREHIDAYAMKHLDDFKVKMIRAPKELAHPESRVTIDTRRDYKEMLRIVNLYPAGKFIRSTDAIRKTYKKNIFQKTAS